MKKNNDLVYIIFMSIVVAFLGYAIENIFQVITHGYLDSRFYILPFIPGYGLIVYIWYFFVKKKREMIDYEHCSLKKKIYYNIILFTIFSVLGFLYELIYGNWLDKFFNVKLWNYENVPTHVTRYASLVTALTIGLLVMTLIKFVLPKLYNWLIKKANPKILLVINIILGSLIILDFIYFYYNVFVYHKAIIYYKIVFFKK